MAAASPQSNSYAMPQGYHTPARLPTSSASHTSPQFSVSLEGLDVDDIHLWMSTPQSLFFFFSTLTCCDSLLDH